ncbi:CAP domain-containing protein [Microvirga lotononidis]|uniref:Peptidase M10 serralysin n=1 Tax=Microvirga lotononidis TaxID=864069 RepID=I4Z2S9_9HYPH|nr:CAP domain-containing protein [Microvirga lotononidis]EIM30521.1 Peptidase M10 serralysin [Microvirga lotononidis]WQO26354.1 CAP domain-containing protein [Microvirga lotononidis]
MSTPTTLETYFLQLVNQTRAQAGAKALTFDGELLDSSDSHSAWMDQTDTFSHTGVNGTSAGQRMTTAGYGWQGWGENIAYVSGPLNEATVQKLHDMLVNSPGHYANIVNGKFEEIGIGLKAGTINGYNVVFVTQNFGTPNAAERAEPEDVGSPAPSTPTPVPAGQVIVGDAYANTLTGSPGDDTLNGKGGKDILTGGSGKDTFVFDTAAEAHGDTLRDFVHGTDRIDLRNIDANTKASGDQSFTFIGSDRFHKVAGELHTYRLSDGNTYVSGDTNGDGAADFAVKVMGNHVFTGADFIL